ncbi:hypothetical protein DPMN_121315 [Dreissena polymorpha]|uniref:Uncharacterized protein n=1 Tax=Dreissena polymorpha TaxID=45954 RepID=A0A9D4JPE4_DREPO|nr:hypothetical protein DPMN_121315 [Dreissena polymorpha]
MNAEAEWRYDNISSNFLLTAFSKTERRALCFVCERTLCAWSRDSDFGARLAERYATLGNLLAQFQSAPRLYIT